MSARPEDVIADALHMPRYWPDNVRFKRPSAILAALAAAGYAVVPTEPTEAMILAAPGRDQQGEEESIYYGIYRAMINSLNAATDRDIERAALEPTR